MSHTVFSRLLGARKRLLGAALAGTLACAALAQPAPPMQPGPQTGQPAISAAPRAMPDPTDDGLQSAAASAPKAHADATAQAPAPAPARKLLFIATTNVPKGKFQHLKRIAAAHGLGIDVRYLNSIAARSGPELFAGYDAVFFDSYMQDSVREHLAGALPGLQLPHAWLYDAQPAWGGGLPDAQARQLITYYSNGGQRNFEGFFALLAAWLGGQRAPADLPEPVIFPKVAVYHPRAPQLVFASAAEFLRWRGVDPTAPASQRPPIVAIPMHQQYIASIQTGFIDDLVARIERGGAIAMPLYGSMMGGRIVQELLQPAATRAPLADVIINTQIMLNAEGRRAEFAALGLPVVQANAYRRGSEVDWAADEHGISLMDVPFFLAQPEYAGVLDIQVAAATRKSDDEILPIAVQAQAVVNKALALARLQRKPAASKQLALMFWNYPPGEKNFSASFLNVPQSIIRTAQALRAAGYDVPEPPPEAELVATVQRLLAPSYREGLLPALVRDNLAALLPVAHYRQWLASLPQATQQALLARWGQPEQSANVITQNGVAYFAIPRLQLGKLALLPLPGRSDRGVDNSAASKEKALYHSTKADALPPHAYLAAYLWVRQGSEGGEGGSAGAAASAASQANAGHDAAAHTPSPGASPARDALIHFGTHGTAEWLPGKERGLSVYDPPMLAVGDVPVVYPYIVDNIGEATQAKRRGRAVIVSHQTPPLRPAGLHERLTAIHDLLHQWLGQAEGAVKDQFKADLLARVRQERITADMGWSDERAQTDFAAFVDELHAHLHELAETVQPVGLHSFGESAPQAQRAATVLMMLGRPFWEAAARHAGTPEAELDETLVSDYQALQASAPYQLLKRYVIDSYQTLPNLRTAGFSTPENAAASQAGHAAENATENAAENATAGATGNAADHAAAAASQPAAAQPPQAQPAEAPAFATALPPELPPALRQQLTQARAWWQALDAGSETQGLLAALAGRYVPTSYGGDPVKNPDALPTGRNLYGFDPSRIPTPQAWAAGKQAAENLIAAHRQQTGQAPTKLAVSLWSVETMRHLGLLEAQALWLMGAQPVWDEGGRVTGVKLVPRAELGRPRVDVVISATGLYRDHFPNAMQQLARAAQLAAQAEGEADNPVAANTRRIAQQLRQRGWAEADALNAAQTRIFSSESGSYGTGLDNATLATDSWQGKAEGDAKLAQLYLSRMQYAYGPDPKRWGSLPAANAEGTGGAGGAGGAAHAPLNLYAEHLRGTQGAVLSRSSNLYGMLTTDDPFQYLGGIGLAVRHLDGKAPELYISNLRSPGSGKVEGAAQFLAKELATRQFHPGYIKGLMDEGYSGTLQVLDATNNFWGWTAVAREIVRDDQWQQIADVYVRDKYQLGLKQWFEQHNPHALAQTIERMVEAARQGYWQADEATLRELKDRYTDLARRYDVRSDNARFTAFVNDQAENLTPTADAAAPAATSNAANAANAATATPAAPGFGLQAPRLAAATPQLAAAVPPPVEAAPRPHNAQPEPEPEPQAPPPQQPPQEPPPVRGLRMEAAPPPQPPQAQSGPADTLTRTLGSLMLLALAALGAAVQARRGLVA